MLLRATAVAVIGAGMVSCRSTRPDVVRIRARRPSMLTGRSPAHNAWTALGRVSIGVSVPCGSASQSRALPSLEPVTTVVPLGSKPMLVTASRWPASGASSRPSWL